MCVCVCMCGESLSTHISSVQCCCLSLTDTLSVGSMVEVAYYIGQRKKMVLALSDIPHSTDSSGLTHVEEMEVGEIIHTHTHTS